MVKGKSRDVEQHFKANSSFRQICSGFDPRMTGLDVRNKNSGFEK